MGELELDDFKAGPAQIYMTLEKESRLTLEEELQQMLGPRG